MGKIKKVEEESDPEPETEEEEDDEEEEEMDLAHLFHHFFTNEEGKNIADILTEMTKTIHLHNQLLTKLIEKTT
jgi:hypothetical protein